MFGGRGGSEKTKEIYLYLVKLIKLKQIALKNKKGARTAVEDKQAISSLVK